MVYPFPLTLQDVIMHNFDTIRNNEYKPYLQDTNAASDMNTFSDIDEGNFGRVNLEVCI